jgi:hypothetical protein
VNESAVSAKVVLGLIGARSAQSETSVRAAAERRPPDLGRSGMEKGCAATDVVCGEWIYDLAAKGCLTRSLLTVLHVNVQYV